MKKGYIFRHGIIALVIVAVLTAIDQYTKLLARQHLGDGSSIDIIKGVFSLVLVENKGMAFSMLSGKTIVFYILTPVICLAVIILYLKLPDMAKYYPMRVCFEFLLAGAVGNYIDRVAKRSVTDFLYFELIDFPVFNVADIYVTCSVVFIMLLILMRYKDEDLERWLRG